MITASSPASDACDWNSNQAALLVLGEKETPQNFWTINDAFQGTQVFGSTGSGKSSGTGEAIARAFLKANFGGLVLTAKTDERAIWEGYCKDAGRESDLLIVSPGSDKRFNFLRYESTVGDEESRTESFVNLFCSVIEVADRKAGGGSGDSYWTRALKQLLRNTVDLLLLSGTEVSLQNLYKVVTSAPTSMAEVADATWQDQSFTFGLVLAAKEKSEASDRTEDLEVTSQFWLREYPMLAAETRSGFVSMFTTMADCFLRGTLRKLFSTDLNFSPEDSFKGKIIILDLPVKVYHELGIFAQVLFKYIWQRAVERRIPAGVTRSEIENTIRPVFLWVDESHFFVNQYDALFQSTARSSRACTVYLTQNLPSYESAFGGRAGASASETFLGNLQTKIFHANGDPKTNSWASSSIGQSLQVKVSTGLSVNDGSKGSSQNSGGALDYRPAVQPQEFTLLRTGGIENDLAIDAVIFQGGRRWLVERSGKEEPVNFIRHTFHQTSKQ